MFALVAQKLIPNMQIIYSLYPAIRSNTEQARKIVEVLNKNISAEFAWKILKIEFKKKIKFENISFCYSDKGKKQLKILILRFLKVKKLE